ncbi:hypothetical protein CsSME_00004968 [Camellia sinensis var. sinensis]
MNLWFLACNKIYIYIYIYFGAKGHQLVQL